VSYTTNEINKNKGLSLWSFSSQ